MFEGYDYRFTWAYLVGIKKDIEVKAIRILKDVRKKVDEMILMDYSPEQIVGVCRKQGIKMVSHETIYQYIWWDKAHGGELYKHLRHRGRRHKKRET